jgi:sulfide:quinone oxidoreductase
VGAREPLRVLIAGGGVAGLEAALALRALAGDRVELELLSPADRFAYRPMLVAEPFGSGGSTTLGLAELLEESGTRHRRDALAAVVPDEHTAITAFGERVGYGALLVALGAYAVDAVPGALAFSGEPERARFAELLEALGRRRTRRFAFVVPPGATWSIAAYELALLTAAERDLRQITGVEITLVTHEASPMELFGAEAAQLVAAKLDEAGVGLRLSSPAERFEGRELRLVGGEALGFDWVIALPHLRVPELPGLPQQEHGFLPTDGHMRVIGMDDVWAAGDATAFPIKQGGLAAQQADIAARSIAARAGADVEDQVFQPMLRAALITGDTPDFMQAPVGDPSAGVASVGQAQWSPRTKLAARHLGPYLARAVGSEAAAEAVFEHGRAHDPVSDDGDVDHARAVRTLLVAADADASTGDFEAALGWLTVVERLNLVIPTDYVVRRDDWRRQLDPDLEPDAAAERIDSRFATANEAISDLQRRLGWLREIEARTGGEMKHHLEDFERGIEDLDLLSRKTGTLKWSR